MISMEIGYLSGMFCVNKNHQNSVKILYKNVDIYTKKKYNYSIK